MFGPKNGHILPISVPGFSNYLDINSGMTVERLLKTFTSEEELEVPWPCHVCKDARKATKQLTIVPEVLSCTYLKFLHFLIFVGTFCFHSSRKVLIHNKRCEE